MVKIKHLIVLNKIYFLNNLKDSNVKLENFTTKLVIMMNKMFVIQKKDWFVIRIYLSASLYLPIIKASKNIIYFKGAVVLISFII